MPQFFKVYGNLGKNKLSQLLCALNYQAISLVDIQIRKRSSLQLQRCRTVKLCTHVGEANFKIKRLSKFFGYAISISPENYGDVNHIIVVRPYNIISQTFG